MRRRTRSRLRVALVVLVVAVLVVEARSLRVQASHNVTACFVQLDDAGRQLDVRHVALRELVDDPKVSPSWIREDALRELAWHVRWLIECLDVWRRGAVPFPSGSRGPSLYHSEQIVRLCGLLPEDRAVAIAAEEQDLAECGVPEPVTIEGARRWYQEVVEKRLAAFDAEPVILGRSSSSAPPPIFDKVLAARELRLRASFQPTRRPLR